MNSYHLGMAKRRDRAAELQAYLSGSNDRIYDTLRALPPDIDPELVVRVANKLLEQSFWRRDLAKLDKLPAAAIRGVLAKLSNQREDWEHVFLQLAVDVDASDAAVVLHWQAALDALGDLNLTYAWGSKARRERFTKLARSPRLLQAIQGTAANCEVQIDLLAVLVADASPESLDALIPHLDDALVAQDVRLDRVTRLKTHAKSTPALRAIMGEIEAARDARNAVSQALALGERIGLGRVPALWFRARMLPSSPAGGVQRIQGWVTVDSRKACWFSVSITDINDLRDMRMTAFDADGNGRDQLGIGTSTPGELPAYFARAAKQLGVQWEMPVPHGNMRGKKRDQIARWLIEP